MIMLLVVMITSMKNLVKSSKKVNPVSLAGFKREYSSLKAQVKEKDARIVELEAQNAELTTKVEELEAGAKTPTKASKTKKDTAEE